MNQRFFWVLLVILSVCGAATAQISEGGTPLSFQMRLDSAVPTVKMPPVDRAAYLAEDAQAPKDAPLRFAAELDVSLNLKNHGVWQTVPKGRLWRLRIESAGAYSLALIYDRWHLPEGGRLFIYNDDHRAVIGAFTRFNNWVEGTNITGHVAGEAVTLEYFEPAAVEGQSVLSIFQVVHAYRNFFGPRNTLDDFGGSGSCNVNVICPAAADWQNQKRGVGMIIEDGSRICSGSLINNTSQNQTPYFLTANHCYSSSATGWIFVFNYESSTCSPSTDGPTTQTVANATLRARSSTSDFCLMELSSNVPSSYNPHFNGWNRVDAAATSSVCIHHPDCDVKKYSVDNDAAVSDRYLGTSGATGSHWKIVDWDVGTTEPGSSGSPLFDQNHRITGQLHGGYAACGNDLSDWFGKFAMSWTGGGTNNTRLSNWLDPGSTGATTLDGYSPVSASLTVTAPNGGESWIIGDGYNITWTSANLSENVCIALNRSYPGAVWDTLVAATSNTGSYAWTASGATSATARVRISGVTHTAVRDTSNANFSLVARTVTVTAPNGGEIWQTGENRSITWTSQYLSGNVSIELNRGYPSGSWESITAGTGNTGSYPWPVTAPAATAARVRIISLSYPAAADTSNADFTILSPNQPPVIAHDPLHDEETVAFTVTAIVADDAPGFVTKFLYRLTGGLFDSLTLSATGNPDEYAASTGPLAQGHYEYFLRATDVQGLVATTDTLYFWVGETCVPEQVYDDGTAEASHWSEQVGYRWAVRFEAAGTPFLLCDALIGVSADHPDAAHSPIEVQVLDDNGPGGLPGSVLLSRTAGSIGNVIGGLPSSPDNFVLVLFRDGLGNPLEVESSFYVAVSNPASGRFEAFLMDTAGARAGRSFVYDPCDSTWHDELSGDSSARPGNRMIRIGGFAPVPPTIVVHREGNDVRLDWSSTGAPFYRVYSATTANGPFTNFLGSTSGTYFVDVGALSTSVKFYVVRAATTP
jgi:V8-like Glu-specific endopeptidase